MMDYSDTLNLPHTPFPMRANLLEQQDEMLLRWQAQDIYRSILEDRRDSRPFIIHDGPPYASGQLHIGIGMNKIIKDIIAKYHAMNDRRVPFVPGWDCHGLPTELEVLRELGSRAKELSVPEIRNICAKRAIEYVQEQKQMFQLLGIFADWDRPYLTMSPAYEAGVLTVFLDMVEKRYVYLDRRPIAWCCFCRTALAEAEIEYLTVAGRSLWLHFEGGADLAELCGVADDISCSLLIWTTTVWSIPGCIAVGVHPELVYGVFKYTDSKGVSRSTLMLEALAATAFKAIGCTEYEKIGEVEGKALAGLMVSHPLFGRSVPVILADYIRNDSGSGLVHLAPGHSLDDFIVCRRHKLDIVSPLDEEGRFNSQAGEFSGMSLADGERAILNSISNRGLLASLGDVKHEYPHCWRCTRPLITRATEQWFIKIDHREKPDGATLREKALIETQIINWIPAPSRQRMHGMIENRPDWCISRQRTWGVPIPAFICRSCGQAILSPAAIRRVRDIVGTYGSAAWFEKSAAELLPAGFSCPACCGHEFQKDGNILDVWFESGSSWQSMLIADHRLSFPADLYVEGSDQYRGWFQLSLLPALISQGKAPFRSALIHGFVLNKRGDRMRRTRGDILTLKDVMKTVPADIVRLYFASVDTWSDIPLAIETFESIKPTYRKIRNTFRQILGNLNDFIPREHSVHLDDLHPLDLWLLCRFHQLISDLNEAYAAYHFHITVRLVHDFCNEDLSRLYLEVLKDRVYCGSPSAEARRSSQTVLHSILMGLVKVLAPILPYTCDEVWALAPGHADCPSVHMSRWPRADEQLLHKKRSQDALETYQQFLQLRNAILPALEKLRGQKLVGDSSDAVVRLHVKGELETLLGVATLSDLREFLVAADVVVVHESEGLEPVSGLEGVYFAVTPSSYAPCPRCRRRSAPYPEAGSEHADLCRRCAEVMQQRDKINLAPIPSITFSSPAMRPADLVKFLRARDVRKVALLNEEDKCRAYALHSPSQEVRPIEELQPLADYISVSPDFQQSHAAVLLGLGEHTDVLFGIGIHHLNYGTPLGGTRESGYQRMRDMLDELLRLSWGMSVKNAYAELPHGGGKSIIDTCGWDLKVHREFRREIYRDFGQFTATLFGRYICAEDVGTTTADTREMLYACRHVMCLSQGVSGSGNPSRFTALAAWAAAKAGWKFLTNTTSFEGLTIALQGAGNVGRNIIAILIEADPGIRRILIADRELEQIQAIRNILLKRGKEGVLEVLSSKDPADKNPSAKLYVEREDEKGKEYILYTPCDILISAAKGTMINAGNVPLLKCRLILPIGNNIYSDNDTVATAMMARGIVDVVENNINWGGAMAAASEIFGYDEENVAAACLEAYHKTFKLLTMATERKCPPWEIVKETALRRIFNEEHPVVHEARQYKFVGNISTGFAEWIKQRWLRNIVDVEPDEFPSYAVAKARGIIG